jgi:hypothetical protein
MAAKPVYFVIMPAFLRPTDGAVPYSVQFHKPDLSELQRIVGGHIELVAIINGAMENCWLVINEEGKLEGLPPNQAATFIANGQIQAGDYIAGNAVLIGTDVNDTAEFGPLPPRIAAAVAHNWEEDGHATTVGLRKGHATPFHNDGNVH